MAIVPTDDVIALLTQDHEAVKERFSEFAHVDPEDRAQRFWELMDQLVRHEVAEEVVVYPALRHEPGGAAVADARLAEESHAERLLAHMEKMDITSEEFMGAMRDLQVAVLEHAAKEESEVFPLLSTNEDEGYLALLGQKFRGEKLAAPNHPHPHFPDSALGQKLVGPVAAFIDRMRDRSETTHRAACDQGAAVVDLNETSPKLRHATKKMA